MREVASSGPASGTGQPDNLLRLIETGYPDQKTRDAFLRDGAAHGPEFFAQSMHRQLT